MMKILLDAGHGSYINGRYDPGAVYDNLRESDIALQYAWQLKYRLQSSGHYVKLTRTDTVGPSLIERMRRASDFDLYLSIHLNSFTREAHGGELWYKVPDYNSYFSFLVNAYQRLHIPWRGFKDARHWGERGMYIVRVKPVAYLWEVGFIGYDPVHEWPVMSTLVEAMSNSINVLASQLK